MGLFQKIQFSKKSEFLQFTTRTELLLGIGCLEISMRTVLHVNTPVALLYFPVLEITRKDVLQVPDGDVWALAAEGDAHIHSYDEYERDCSVMTQKIHSCTHHVRIVCSNLAGILGEGGCILFQTLEVAEGSIRA